MNSELDSRKDLHDCLSPEPDMIQDLTFLWDGTWRRTHFPVKHMTDDT
jgi:hypothetical protein